jgi:hypothetical protein
MSAAAATVIVVLTDDSIARFCAAFAFAFFSLKHEAPVIVKNMCQLKFVLKKVLLTLEDG